MPFPIWMLLGFAVWTVFLLLGTVGVYRWSRILTGRVPISEFRADNVEGEFYRRAMRAHANCVENLPVFAAIVFALHVSGASGATIDALTAAVLASRVAQSLVHVSFVQTDLVASIRFGFFFVQILSFLSLAALAASHAAGAG